MPRRHLPRLHCQGGLHPTAGVFKAWVLVGARLYSVPLRVPRRFYVNSVLAPEDPESPAQTLGGLRVNRTLPFGTEAFHIYEASLPDVPAINFKHQFSHKSVLSTAAKEFPRACSACVCASDIWTFSPQIAVLKLSMVMMLSHSPCKVQDLHLKIGIHDTGDHV